MRSHVGSLRSSTRAQTGLAALLTAACISTAFATVYWPNLVAGVILGAMLLALVFLRPLVVIAFMLVAGPVDLSFLTGGFKSLFLGVGGLDMNGIRLVAITAGFAMLLLVDREATNRLVSRDARIYLLFLLYGAVSLVTSIAPLDGLRLLLKIAYPFLTYIVVLRFVEDERTLRRLMTYTLGTAALITFIINPLFVLGGAYTVDYAGFVRVHGMGSGYSAISFYLFAMLLISFTHFLTRWQWRYLVLCGGLAVWIALTLTRITLLASLSGIFTIVMVAVVAARNRRALIAGVCVALVVAILLVPAVLERSLGFVPTPAELVSLLTSPRRLYSTINWEGRQALWAIAGQGFIADPLTGLGPGATTALLRENLASSAPQVAHNEYIRVASEMGIVGVILYFVAVMTWLIAATRAAFRGNSLVREYAYPAVGAIIGWAFIAVTDNAFNYYSDFTQYIGFLCAGSLVALRLTTDKQAVDV